MIFMGAFCKTSSDLHMEKTGTQCTQIFKPWIHHWNTSGPDAL